MYLDDFFKTAPHIQIDQLSSNSKERMNNCIFFCVKGIRYNGHDYVDEAILNGANVIVYSDDIPLRKSAVFVKVNNVNDTLINVSNKFYNYPSDSLESYIISGTNGRSSVSSIINFLLAKRKKVSSIGIFGINYGDINEQTNQPTLTILDNQKTFSRFLQEGCKACTLEASALSLSYNKLDMVKPNAFVYTYTCSDSSEYKESGLSYVDSLKRYLYTLDETSVIVLNKDDETTYIDLNNAASTNKVSYGQNEEADYVISNVKLTNNKSFFTLKHLNISYQIETKLLGLINVYNITSSLVALNQCGYKIQDLIVDLKEMECVEGILDRLKFEDFNIYVDSASAYENLAICADFAKTITNQNNKIITIASVNTTDSENRLKNLINTLDGKSDIIILTEDDTYEDDINVILNKAEEYVKKSRILLIEDREEAIEQAIELLNKNDSLFILGKGNENFLYKGLVKKNYPGDKNIAYKYMNKRLREEKEEYF